MSKAFIFLWTLIVIGLLSCVLIFGISFKEQKELEYKKSLEKKALKYIKKNELKKDSSINVTMDDLIDSKLIKNNNYKNKTCDGYITITNKNNSYEIDNNIKCKKNTKLF